LNESSLINKLRESLNDNLKNIIMSGPIQSFLQSLDDAIFSFELDELYDNIAVNGFDIELLNDSFQIDQINDIKLEKQGFKVIFRLFGYGISNGTFTAMDIDLGLYNSHSHEYGYDYDIADKYPAKGTYSNSKVIAKIEIKASVNANFNLLINSLQILSINVDVGMPEAICAHTSHGSVTINFD
jgi:hypothetical protein